MKVPVRLQHGTSALSVDAIRREGIRESSPGRGVGLMHTDDLPVSKYNAWRAEWRHRYLHGSTETVGLGAVVTVDTSKLGGVVFAPLGIIHCPHDAWYVEHVPPSAIVGIETFPLALPDVNSPVDVAMCAQGVGIDRSTSKVTPTMRIVQERLAEDDPCDRVTITQYAASVELSRLRVESWEGLRTPSARVLALARKSAADALAPVDPVRGLTNGLRMRRYARLLSEPGNAALAIDGEFVPALKPYAIWRRQVELEARRRERELPAENVVDALA